MNKSLSWKECSAASVDDTLAADEKIPKAFGQKLFESTALSFGPVFPAT